MSYVYGQALTTVGPTPTPTTTAAPTTTLPPVTTTTTVVPLGTTTTVMPVTTTPLPVTTTPLPVTTTPLPVTTTVMPTTTAAPTTCLGACTYEIVEKQIDQNLSKTYVLKNGTCSAATNCICSPPTFIEIRTSKVGDIIITNCYTQDKPDKIGGVPTLCGPCVWDYRKDPLLIFDMSYLVLKHNACGNFMYDQGNIPVCSGCSNPMLHFTEEEIRSMTINDIDIQTPCENNFNANSPPPEPPTLYEGCNSTCDCEWKVFLFKTDSGLSVPEEHWDCFSNCPDSCACSSPSLVVKDFSFIRDLYKEIPIFGRYIGDKAKSACIPKSKLLTQANLDVNKIAMGIGYEAMPMGLDTTLDSNGNSMQLTSYITYVNGQKQVKVVGLTNMGSLLNLNIEGLNSIPGVVDATPSIYS
jgi:hypothetical protein